MTYTPHFNQAGEAHIVDISEKSVTQRIAIPEGYIEMQSETLKKTAELIPLCHPIFITHVEIDLIPELKKNRVRCQTTVKTISQTGVEMEALTATQIALLTIYDMCKGMDRGMVIQSVRLLEKEGGKSGHWLRG
jgi:cyclic pyranopterin phosphate synthase